MNKFTAEQIQERFEKLPKELQDAVSAPEVRQKIEEIAKRHELHVDQQGELVDQIGLVMLGLERSSSFVSDVSSRLSIGQKEAREIADDINKEIFAAIKNHLQELEKKAETEDTDSAKESGIADLEHIGGFSIEKEKGEPEAASLKVPEKDRILSTLEDSAADPMIDHLLVSPNAQTEDKVAQQPEPHHTEPPIPANLPTDEKKAPATPMPAVTPKAPARPKGPDQYREPIN